MEIVIQYDPEGDIRLVDRIILYGSYAKGTPYYHSDIDIAIISPSFKGKKILETQAELARVLAKFLSI